MNGVFRTGPSGSARQRLEVDGCEVSLEETVMALGVVTSMFFLRTGSPRMQVAAVYV
jgi:hypothetical protein